MAKEPSKENEQTFVQVSVMLPVSLQSTLVATASGHGSAPSDWAVNALQANVESGRTPALTVSPTVSKLSDSNRCVPLNLLIPGQLDTALQNEALKLQRPFRDVVVEKLTYALNRSNEKWLPASKE
jgi:hypothetical protein